MTPEWWQPQHVKHAMAQHDAQHAADATAAMRLPSRSRRLRPLLVRPAMTGTAHCQRCDWTTAGTITEAGKAAEQHTRKTGHPTATITTPASRRLQ